MSLYYTPRPFRPHPTAPNEYTTTRILTLLSFRAHFYSGIPLTTLPARIMITSSWPYGALGQDLRPWRAVYRK